MNGLDFINDKELRKTLENSIEYIYVLHERSKSDGRHKLYQEETYRVILLYVASIIEAILLYFYKVRGEKIQYTEYKFVNVLLSQYEHTEKKGFPVVVAVQEKVEKKEHQLGMRELVTFFRGKSLMTEKTAEDILDINDVRNTIHFSKPRAKVCDLKLVERAFKLLMHTIKNAPRSLELKT